MDIVGIDIHIHIHDARARALQGPEAQRKFEEKAKYFKRAPKDIPIEDSLIP